MEPRKNNPLVSVIIPALNAQDFLGECIDSVLGQTLRDIEVICVNDGSIDDTLSIMERYGEKDGRVRVIDEVNKGLSGARNAGFAVSTGKYILYVDSDDSIKPDTLENLVRQCDGQLLDVIFFCGESIYENETLKEEHPNYKTYYTRETTYPGVYRGEELFALQSANKEYLMSACLQMARRDFLVSNDIRFEEGILHEDNLYTFQVILKAERAACVNDSYYVRSVRADSIMTRELTHRNLYGYYICYRKMLDFAARQNLQDPEVIRQVERHLISRYGHVRRIYNKISKAERKMFLGELGDYDRLLFRTVMQKDIESRAKNEKLKAEAEKQKAAAAKAKKTAGYRMEEAVKRPLRKVRRALGM